MLGQSLQLYHLSDVYLGKHAGDMNILTPHLESVLMGESSSSQKYG